MAGFLGRPVPGREFGCLFDYMKTALIQNFCATFDRAPNFVARAPGRIEFIGNHTDYNGGAVIGAAIDRGVWVGLALRTDGLWRFVSDRGGEAVTVAAGNFSKLVGGQSWVNYPLGVLAALPDFGLRVPGGFDYLAISDLPAGAGLSSSAAIELSSGLVFLAATQQKPSRETLVQICRHAENTFVGVPCGILDQGVSGFGRKNHLVSIDCRGPIFTTVPLPADAHFWIFNTHTKHALVDGLYAERHRVCMEAAKNLGVSLLADATEESIRGAESRLSPVAYKRARHIFEEILRVEATSLALRTGDLSAVGRLLTASHRSSQTWFENSTPELDFLVDTLTATPHVFGARLTGGGFGGAVMALTSGAFGAAQAEAVGAAYAAKFGAQVDVLHTQTDDGGGIAGLLK